MILYKFDLIPVYNLSIFVVENDDRDENSVDIPNPTPDRGWSLWGLVRAGWNVKEDISTSIQPDQGKNNMFIFNT